MVPISTIMCFAIPYYTAYFTRENKNCLTLMEILNEDEPAFLLNSQTMELLIDSNLSEKQRQRLVPLLRNRIQCTTG